MAITTQSLAGGFDARVESRGTVSAVALTGELDADTAPRTHDALAEAIATASEIVVLDLTGTTFIDSSGIELVVRFERRAAAGGLDVVIVGARPEVRRVFDLCGLGFELAFA